MDLKFRRITSKDGDFLREVLASALSQDIATMNWSVAQADTYIDHQFKAQHKSYQQKFPNAAFEIVLVDGEKAGRRYVDRRRDEIRIVELTLLPEFRGQGIGTKLINALCEEATEQGLVVGVHIPKGWRAMQLAQRLGFAKQLETEFSDYMVWKPGSIIT